MNKVLFALGLLAFANATFLTLEANELNTVNDPSAINGPETSPATSSAVGTSHPLTFDFDEDEDEDDEDEDHDDNDDHDDHDDNDDCKDKDDQDEGKHRPKHRSSLRNAKPKGKRGFGGGRGFWGSRNYRG